MKTKQVILIRKDLKMRRGKEIAQGSHAALEFLLSGIDFTADGKSTITLGDATRHWITNGKPKICLRVNSEDELLKLHNQALQSGLKSYLIRDSGRTEFSGVPTLTACAIGPNVNEDINQVTGSLTPYLAEVVNFEPATLLNLLQAFLSVGHRPVSHDWLT